MQSSTIFFIVFFGMIFGILLGIFIFKRKRKRQIKKAIGRIKNQNIKYRVGGKEYNFVEHINNPSAPTENYLSDAPSINLKDKKEKRPSKKNAKKEDKKYPYKKVRKGVKKK